MIGRLYFSEDEVGFVYKERREIARGIYKFRTFPGDVYEYDGITFGERISLIEGKIILPKKLKGNIINIITSPFVEKNKIIGLEYKNNISKLYISENPLYVSKNSVYYEDLIKHRNVVIVVRRASPLEEVLL